MCFLPVTCSPFCLSGHGKTWLCGLPSKPTHYERSTPAMLDIYICEDDKAQLDLFSDYISKSILIDDLDMRLALSTQDYHEILDVFSPSGNIGVFFLDIDLNADINGLALAQHIRRIQPRCYIIFITSHKEYGLETFHYKVEALDFICKDEPDKIHSRIHDCLLDIKAKVAAEPVSFHFKRGERHTSIPFDEIVSFHIADGSHKVTLCTMNKMLEFPGSLKEIETHLDHRFYRCHRSYIINKDYIDTADFDILTVNMKNGMRCPISFRMKRGLKKLLSKK